MKIKCLLLLALFIGGCGESIKEGPRTVRWDDSRVEKVIKPSSPSKEYVVGDLVVPAANQVLVGQVVRVYQKYNQTVWSYLVKFPIDSYESYYSYEIRSISKEEAQKIWDRVNIIQVFDN